MLKYEIVQTFSQYCSEIEVNMVGKTSRGGGRCENVIRANAVF